jgi:hypothetical protein
MIVLSGMENQEDQKKHLKRCSNQHRTTCSSAQDSRRSIYSATLETGQGVLDVVLETAEVVIVVMLV